MSGGSYSTPSMNLWKLRRPCVPSKRRIEPFGSRCMKTGEVSVSMRTLVRSTSTYMVNVKANGDTTLRTLIPLDRSTPIFGEIPGMDACAAAQSPVSLQRLGSRDMRVNHAAGRAIGSTST